VDKTELTGINFTGIDLLCKLKVNNPNSITIPFPEIDWDLFVNANHFVNGVIKNDKKLEAKKTSVVDVPVHINYQELYKVIMSVKDASKAGTRETGYKLALTTKFNLPILGELSFPFEVSGAIPLLQMPKLTGAAISIDKIDFTGIDLVAALNLENPNVFEIPFPTMNFDYSVNKNSLLKSSVETGGPLAANGVSPVKMRLSLKYADLYKNVQSLTSVGEAAGLLALAGALSAVPALADEKLSLDIANKLPLLKMPAISFKGINVSNINVSELLTGTSKIDFTMSFEVENKNSFSMNLDGLDYKLAVNGTQWVQGLAPNKAVVGPNQKVTIPLNLSVNALSLVKDIAAMVVSRKSNIPYTCEGGFTASGDYAGLKPISVPFNLSGILPSLKP
jgi:LEA14-like dessication related protein